MFIDMPLSAIQIITNSINGNDAVRSTLPNVMLMKLSSNTLGVRVNDDNGDLRYRFAVGAEITQRTFLMCTDYTKVDEAQGILRKLAV